MLWVSIPAARNAEHVPRALAMKEKHTVLHSVEILKKIENWVHGSLQNCARLKKVRKKTSETSAGQSSLGGV
jgi:hypothetical protein